MSSLRIRTYRLEIVLLIVRPCGACVKKGYSIDQCIDGCESCRKARVRCEGGKPCQRCREMEQECADEQVTTGTRSDVAPPVFVLRNRQKSERAKLACQNCRRDNKKVRTGSLSLSVRVCLEVFFVV